MNHRWNFEIHILYNFFELLNSIQKLIILLKFSNQHITSLCIHFFRIFCGKSANGFSCPHSFWPIHKELIKIAFSELKILFRSFCTIFNGGECNASRNRMIGCFPWIYLDLCSETTTFQCVFGKRVLFPPPSHEQI